jgi:RimJ/RimL family protein N-acetyltransferase/nitroimidazol reductase NimA-like FMN-containing flavoprotein (pyridoxamine 5'-phosphate oxidase superfamily)
MTETFSRTDRTTPRRRRDRASYERATAYAILDEAYHGHVGFIIDGEARVLPTLHARVDDTLYLHGSTGATTMLAARGEGLPVCVTVTHLDGLVLARSWMHHSANYRCVVAHGRAHLVTDEAEKHRALTAVMEKVAAGRSADSRPPTSREYAETAVLALTLREVSVKARVGGVMDDEEDLGLQHWAGVIPLRLQPGTPSPDLGVRVALPAYLQPDRGPWLTAPTLRGDHVALSQLDMSHVDGLFAAVADAEVYRWQTRPLPSDTAEMGRQVAEALRMQQQGFRVPFVQTDARTGEIIGTTSYYSPDETNRTIAIGYTMLARARWRTGANTESKLMLMRHAFEILGAVRVEWHTDLCNERSQRAIERLGATREGVLRRHRLRPDGTWRDTVQYSMTDAEWPSAQIRLQALLRDPAPQASPDMVLNPVSIG